MAEPTAHTEVPGGAEHHAEPAIFGIFDASVIVALVMATVIIWMIMKNVPSAIGKSLDRKIAAIREQLEEAEGLRKDAEVLERALRTEKDTWLRSRYTFYLAQSFFGSDEKEKALHGDFAGGERTQPLTPEAEESALLEGDFAKGERKVPLTEEEKREAEMHGDFASGERTEPLTPESVEEGSFAPDKK